MVECGLRPSGRKESSPGIADEIVEDILCDATVSRTPLLTRLFTHLHRSDAWNGHH